MQFITQTNVVWWSAITECMEGSKHLAGARDAGGHQDFLQSYTCKAYFVNAYLIHEKSCDIAVDSSSTSIGEMGQLRNAPNFLEGTQAALLKSRPLSRTCQVDPSETCISVSPWVMFPSWENT
eukprot:284951-Amphidinium_carterae.2